MKRRIAPRLSVLALAVLVTASCNHGDHVAPEGSTINVAATPSTVLISEQVVSGGNTLTCFDVLNVSKCGTSEIVATVSSVVGVPLPDQDVRFTNTSGLLYTGTLDNPEPIANLPIRTDSYGNAHVNLVTGSTSTVNARSGKATGSLSLQTTSAFISSISVLQDTDSPGCSSKRGEITACSDLFCLTATVRDDKGKGIPGLLILFRLQGATGELSFTGTFDPENGTTNDAGIVATTLQGISSECSKCAGGKCVSVDVVAYIDGGIESPVSKILINIP